MTAPERPEEILGRAIEPHMWIYAGTLDENACDSCAYPKANKGAHPDYLQPQPQFVPTTDQPLQAAALDPNALRDLPVDLNEIAYALETLLSAVNTLRGVNTVA